MSSDARRRRGPRPPEQPSESKPWRERSPFEKVRDTLGVLLLVGWIGLFFVAGEIGGAYVDLVRSVTGGQDQAMGAAGWAIFFAPFGAFWWLVATGFTLDTPRGYALGTAIAVLVPVMLNLAPIPGGDALTERVSGPGGGAFVTGLSNGALGGIVPVVVAPVIGYSERVRKGLGEKRQRQVLTVGITGFALCTLIAAVALAG